VLDNPLPASTGRVCQHPCEAAAAPHHRRIREHARSAPVHRRRYLSIRPLSTPLWSEFAPENCPPPTAGGGGGRGGLVDSPRRSTCRCGARGHHVRFNAEPGGMLRYALPEYRLPREVVRREVELIRRMA